MDNKPKPCDITPQQSKLWDETRVAMLWHAPAFTHIFYTMLNKEGRRHVALFTRDIPIAATDGIAVLINPDTFFKLPLMMRVFIVIHEIMHCVWQHMLLMHQFLKSGEIIYPDGRKLPYDPDTMNYAADLVINDLLITAKTCGDFPLDSEGKPIGVHDPSIATGKDLVLDIYRKLYKKPVSLPQGGGAGQSGNNPSQNGNQPGSNSPPPRPPGFDKHLSPGASQGKDPTTAASEHNPQAWQAAIAEAANAAKLQGKLPAGLERAFMDVLEPAVNWQEHIQALFARRLGTGSYNWRSPDRRMITRDFVGSGYDAIIAPGRSGFGAELVVIGGDTSGSIDPPTLDIFLAEVAGILADVRPRRVLIAWCDAKLHRVDEVDEPGDLNIIRHEGAPGGGGTDFRPVFDYIQEQGLNPDALVYLTDLEGTFPPEKPSYPCIWGCITSKIAPFGDTVYIPQQVAS